MMNYYAQGGQTLGIKSLAQQLPIYGRYNDDMVAHISSDEARLLQAMGGAGTINPITGLPEYGLGKLFKAVEKPFRSSGAIGGALKPIIKPIRDAIQDLGPVATIAATYFGGPIGAGIVGGLSGQKGFDFKRALLSGAMAYGAQNLAQGVSDFGGTPGMEVPGISLDDAGVALLPADAAAMGSAGSTVVPPISLDDSANALLPSDSAAMQNGLSSFPTEATPGFFDQIGSGNFSGALDQVGNNISDGLSNIYNDASDFGRGIKNIGSGNVSMSQFSNAVKNAPGNVFGIGPQGLAAASLIGYTGLAGMDEAEKMKNEADLAGAKSQEEYDAIMARIETSRLRGVEAIKANPYMFAMGGSVDDEVGIDSLNFETGNMQNGMFGGQLPSYAKGGEPRFLSGGGDGMSDDIKATINDKQPARLADGEFVIPADVVSHLGNGSSKAGAKQLYSMMDRVRSARTGNKKQGKQIKPAKFMPA